MKINKSILGIIFTLLLQLLGTVCFVWRYERILLKGEEVRLKCMPYDPYDPLKGRYLMVTVKAEQLLSSRSKDAVAVYRLLDQKIILTDIEIEGVSILRRVREL